MTPEEQGATFFIVHIVIAGIGLGLLTWGVLTQVPGQCCGLSGAGVTFGFMMVAFGGHPLLMRGVPGASESYRGYAKP